MIALMLALAGCTRYRPEPIDAAASARALAHRQFDAPDLRRFLTRMGASASPPFGLRALVLVAVYERPTLRIARARYAVARGGVVTARALPNPVLGIEPTFNATQPVPSPIEIGPVVQFLLGSLGARQAGIAAARDETAAARHLIADAARLEHGRVSKAMLALWTATHRAAALRQEAQIADEARAAIVQRKVSGLVSETVSAAATERAESASLAAADAARAVAVARAKLAAAVGMPETALDGVKLSFAAYRHPAEPGALAPLVQNALVHRPDVMAALERYDAAEARLRQAIANQFPGIRIGPGYHYDQGDSKFILSVSLPLPILNQNQGPIAEARARRRLAAAQFEAVQENALAAIDTAWADWRASRKEEEAARALAETARRHLASTRTDFHAGASDRLALLGAEENAAHADTQAFETHARTLMALDALGTATDQPMFDTEAR